MLSDHEHRNNDVVSKHDGIVMDWKETGYLLWCLIATIERNCWCYETVNSILNLMAEVTETHSSITQEEEIVT